MDGKTTVKELSKFSRDDFADWIWCGLSDLYSGDKEKKIRAFSPAGAVIRQFGAPVDGLAFVYQKLSSRVSKKKFRSALGDVLRSHCDEEGILAPFKDILYLIAEIKAEESLKAIIPGVMNGRLGQTNPEILFDTIAILQYLAPSRYAFSVAEDIINSGFFKEDFFFDILKVLIECNPNDTAEMLLKYEARLSEMHETFKGLGEEDAFYAAADELIEHALIYAPFTWVKKIWDKIEHCSRQSWFILQIFMNQNECILAEEDPTEDKFRIRLNESILELKISDKNWHNARAILGYNCKNELMAWACSDGDPVANSVCIKAGEICNWGQMTCRLEQIDRGVYY